MIQMIHNTDMWKDPMVDKLFMLRNLEGTVASIGR